MQWERDPGWRDGPQGKEGTPPVWMVITKMPREYGTSVLSALHLQINWKPCHLRFIRRRRAEGASQERIAADLAERYGLIVEPSMVGSKLRALDRWDREHADAA